MSRQAYGVPVSDPTGLASDPEMPFAASALDPEGMARRLARLLPEGATLRAIRVVRHKPGRRALVEYEVEGYRSGEEPPPRSFLLGKIRKKGLDETVPDLHANLRRKGFGDGNAVFVPEPVGVLPELRMWLQRRVPGEPATGRLAAPGGVALARRIAEAAHGLHAAGVPARRRHTMDDELRILYERLPAVARERPQLAGRIGRVLAASRRLGEAVPEARFRGIHRDFYGDQVLVSGDRLCLLDLDLYCEGNPALDAGNFVAHLTEQALRTLGNPLALADREAALEERFVELAGEAARPALRAYATLTLVRHVHIGTRIPERRHLTEDLLELCEERLRVPAKRGAPGPVGRFR